MPSQSVGRQTLAVREEAMPNRRTGPAGVIPDRITGKLKKVAGAILGDEQLSTEGELHEERAAAATEAARAAE
jgi:hypothetical protein